MCGELGQHVANCMSAAVEVVLFPKPKYSTNSRFMFSDQVEVSLRGDDQVLVWFISLIVQSDVMDIDMHVVCEFPDVFLEDICDLLPKLEVIST